MDWILSFQKKNRKNYWLHFFADFSTTKYTSSRDLPPLYFFLWLSHNQFKVKEKWPIKKLILWTIRFTNWSCLFYTDSSVPNHYMQIAYVEIMFRGHHQTVLYNLWASIYFFLEWFTMGQKRENSSILIAKSIKKKVQNKKF